MSSSIDLLKQIQTVRFKHSSTDRRSIFSIFGISTFSTENIRACFVVLNQTIEMQSISRCCCCCCCSRALPVSMCLLGMCDAFVWRNITSYFVFNSIFFALNTIYNATCFFHYYTQKNEQFTRCTGIRRKTILVRGGKSSKYNTSVFEVKVVAANLHSVHSNDQRRKLLMILHVVGPRSLATDMFYWFQAHLLRLHAVCTNTGFLSIRWHFINAKSCSFSCVYHLIDWYLCHNIFFLLFISIKMKTDWSSQQLSEYIKLSLKLERRKKGVEKRDIMIVNGNHYVLRVK